MRDNLTINSIVNCFKLLECFTGQQSRLTLMELVRKLNISVGAAQRITHTLTILEYLYKDPKTKTFQLTPKILSLGFAFLHHSGLRDIVLPHLKKLNEATNETVNLAILDGAEIVYLERVQTSHLITTNIRPGSRRPIHCTSMGKVILAFSAEDEREKILSRISFEKYTEKTIINKNRFVAELNKIRKSGYAENNSELDKDLFAIAAPLLNNNGEAVGGINMVIPMSRVSKDKIYKEYLPLLIEKGNQISADLGHRRQ
ncbi:MAG: IclR family transcriptional regulator [Deltaproteobacteria bacterium]|nr:IclR family transcriptional regulator [Deltaproteobacteria bacterium]